jgi:hypothetical protein
VTRREHPDLSEAHPSRPDRRDPGRPHPLAALLRLPALPQARLCADPPHDSDRVHPRPALGLPGPPVCPPGTGQRGAGVGFCAAAPAGCALRASSSLGAQGTKTEQPIRLPANAWRVGRIHSGRLRLSSHLSDGAMSSFLIIRSRGGRAGARIRPSHRWQDDCCDRPLSAPMRGNRRFPLITLPLKIAFVFASSGQRVFTG